EYSDVNVEFVFIIKHTWSDETNGVYETTRFNPLSLGSSSKNPLRTPPGATSNNPSSHTTSHTSDTLSSGATAITSSSANETKRNATVEIAENLTTFEIPQGPTI